MTNSLVANCESSLLEIRNLVVEFTDRRMFGGTRAFRAVDDVSLNVGAGEIVAILGASGSGKTTVIRAATGLQKMTKGQILYRGDAITQMNRVQTRLRHRRVQLIFQDPTESLNPGMKVGRIIREGLDIHNIGSAAEKDRRLSDALSFVGLTPVEHFVNRYPHSLSGGQRQRVAIAAALVLEPDLLVADEPVSMLDPSIRAGILKLFARLRDERGMSTLMVTHDLPSVHQIADTVHVMNKGRVVEKGRAMEIFEAPAHDYTRALIRAAGGALKETNA